MIVIAVLVWIVAILSLRVAFMGNQPSKVIKGLSEKDLVRLDKLAQEGTRPRNPYDAAILVKFSWVALIDMGLFFLETALAFYFLLGEGYKWLSIILLKNVLAVWIAHRQAPESGKPFTAISKLSSRLLVLDRLSAAISAIIFIYLFLIIACIIN